MGRVWQSKCGDKLSQLSDIAIDPDLIAGFPGEALLNPVLCERLVIVTIWLI